MKILTTNFLTCAIKACKTSPTSFPLHFKDAELVQQETDYNPRFIRNILPRIDWDALRTTAAELGFTSLPESKPEFSGVEDEDDKRQEQQEMMDEDGKDDERRLLRDLHTLLLETQVMEGALVCGNCGHEYSIKEGIANFLLPSHLV